MTPSKALFFYCIAFVAGVAIESLVRIPQIILWGFLIFGVFAIFISFWNTSLLRFNLKVWGFFALFLAIGIMRLQVTEFNFENDKLQKLNDLPQNITLAGQIVAEPDVRSSYQKLKVRLENTNSIVLISTGNYPEYKYLDEIKATGQLKTPPEFEDFNYKNYLQKDGIISLMDFPKIELVSKKHGYNVLSFLFEKILFAKEKLKKSVDSNFAPPQNFILNGIVFGEDKNWPADLKSKFNITGLSHITAVSGSNIVMLINVLVVVFLVIGLWRQQALWASFVLVWIYISLVGFPASGVRAGIMGSILLLAQIFGRQNTSSRTIVLAGALMIMQKPLLLFHDIGFQLSFLASMGIIHLKPIFDNTLFSITSFWAESKNKLKKAVSLQFRNLFDIVSITVVVQILIMPVVIYNFSSVSLVSLLTNLLVLPIVPLVMFFGLLASSLGIFSGFLGWVFALPCYALIFYLLKVLETFSQPWATLEVKNIFWAWFLVYYIILLFCIWFLQRKLKPKFLGY